MCTLPKVTANFHSTAARAPPKQITYTNNQMNRRTSDLPPIQGLAGILRDLRYSEFFRQTIGLLLMPVMALLSSPNLTGFMVGAALALIGTIVRVYASGFIIKNKQLATDGPYSLVRHPLYTGNLLLLIGFTFASGQWWALIVSAGFWWFYYPAAIEYEDRKLRGIFGGEWEQWSQSVPAVIPASLRFRGGGGWSFQTSMMQNYEPVIVLFTLVWLGLMWVRLG
jgi:protein-S-isoprenylcysteine O-methyltransferase Ste14